MGDVEQKQTCMECARKCLNIHRKKPSSVSNSTPLSFFKIMIDDFREVLFIPPKFDLLGELVDCNVYLEDSDGNSSSVKLSVKDGSVVFQEGWREFVLDHSIEVGEFVVFKYVGELFFSVQIFGVNACERLCFHDENKNNLCKKNKYKIESSPKESQLPKRRKSSEVVRDKCHPVNENSLKKEPETKNDLSDLPDIEFIRTICAEKDQSEPEKSPHFLGNSGGPKTGRPPGFSKQTCEIENCHEIRKGIQSEDGLHSFGNAPVLVSRKEDAPCAADSDGSAPQNLPDMGITEGNTCQSGIMPDGFMEDDEERTTPCLKEKNLKAVKTERMDSDDLEEQSLPKSIVLSFTFSSNAQSWIELPQTLPCHIGKKRHGMRVVTLQDPSMRLWPVLYHESFKFVGFLSGWKDFVAANNLQQGNLCELIEVAGAREPTFQVRISKVSGQS